MLSCQMDKILGSPYRLPAYTFPIWGIRPGTPIRISEEYYLEEWEYLTEEEHKDIAEAARRAGIGDAPKILNTRNAEIISQLIDFFDGRVFILDVGAGAGDTSVHIYNHLDEEDKRRVFFTLLDPAAAVLRAAERRLKELGLRKGDDFIILQGRDLDIPHLIEPEAHQIVTAVASVHHHPSLFEPFKFIYDALQDGGFFITADWHHTMWEHPNRVYRLLQRMDWPKKEEGLKNFVETYPAALEEIPDPEDPKDKKANEQISLFWIEYSKMEHKTRRFAMLEGHRPAWWYLRDMEAVGFKTNTDAIRKVLASNPFQLLPDSSLLCICLGQK